MRRRGRSVLSIVASLSLITTSRFASAFFKTSLDDFIANHGVDSLIVTGLSTSGCVRSTVVDAAARGLRTILVIDAVADRLEISHTVALLDIWMKYGDLCTTDTFVEFASHARHSTDGAAHRAGNS